MRLERIVMLVRRAIGLIDLHRGGREGGIGVALLEEALRAIDALIAELLHVEACGRFVVRDFTQLRAARRVLEGIANDDGDSLADVVNRRIVERDQLRLAKASLFWLREFRRVEMRDDRDDA